MRLRRRILRPDFLRMPSSCIVLAFTANSMLLCLAITPPVSSQTRLVNLHKIPVSGLFMGPLAIGSGGDYQLGTF